jgi:predicted ATP-grasp superfamily ATP-dependent carboligase
LNIGQHDELGEQMDIEVDVEELKYNAGEMRKKYQALKTTLRKVQKSKNGRANPALFEQREQTLNDFKSKVS